MLHDLTRQAGLATLHAVVIDVALVVLLAQAPVQWRADPAAGATCDAGPRVDAALAALGASPQTEIVIDATRGPNTWIARISIRGDAPLERTIDDPDCATLARAVALVIAVNMVPVATASSASVQAVIVPEVITEPTRDEPSTPPAARPIASEPARPTAPRRPIGGAWLLGAGIDAGRFPRVLGTVTTAVALRIGAARFELGAVIGLPRELPHPARPTVSARVQAIAGNVRACWVLRAGRLEAPVCAGAEAGVVLASGLGLSRNGDATSPWAAALVGPRLGWNVAAGRVTVMPWIGVEALVSLVRPRFVVDDLPGNLARAEPAGARVLAGIELKWGDETRRTRR